jgi:hypothetical protein
MVTGAVFLAAAGSFAGLTIWDRRPRESLNPPLLPTIPMLFITGTVAFLALVLLVHEIGAQL